MALSEFMMEMPPELDPKAAALLNAREVQWDESDPHRPSSEERQLERRIRQQVQVRARAEYERALRREKEQEQLELERENIASPTEVALLGDGEPGKARSKPLDEETLAELRQREGIRANVIAAKHSPQEYAFVDEEDRLIVDGVTVPQNLAHHFYRGPTEFVGGKRAEQRWLREQRRLMAIKERKALRGGVKRQSTWKVDVGEVETRRQKRVSANIYRRLFDALELRALMPIDQLPITFDKVSISTDMLRATIYWSANNPGNEAETKQSEEVLECLKPLLRREITRLIAMKFSPELLFEQSNKKWQRLAKLEEAFREIEKEVKEVSAKFPDQFVRDREDPDDDDEAEEHSHGDDDDDDDSADEEDYDESGSASDDDEEKEEEEEYFDSESDSEDSDSDDSESDSDEEEASRTEKRA